jgi:hypothetical protein
VEKGHSLLDANRKALDAAATGDVEALELALAERQAAIENASIAERVKALKEGEAVQLLIRGIKLRLRTEIGRLEQIKTALVRSAEPPPKKIDLRA